MKQSAKIFTNRILILQFDLNFCSAKYVVYLAGKISNQRTFKAARQIFVCVLLPTSDGKALEHRHQSESLATFHGVLWGVYYLTFYIIPVECTRIPKVGL